MARKPNSREALLDAAEAVASQSGAAHLTLDAVAARAGVSKGGLLYHFPSKEALLQGMLTRNLSRADEDRERFKSAFAAGPAAALKAYIRAGFEVRTEDQKVCAALLAAGANNPELLGPVKAWHARNSKELTINKTRRMRVLAIMLAIDGLWLNDLLGTMPLSKRDRKALMKELLTLADSAK